MHGFLGGHFSLFPAPLGHQLNALNWKKIVFLSDSDRVCCLNQARSYIALCRWCCILPDSSLHATGVKSSSWWPAKGSATFSLYCWVQRRFSDLVICASWVFNLKPGRSGLLHEKAVVSPRTFSGIAVNPHNPVYPGLHFPISVFAFCLHEAAVWLLLYPLRLALMDAAHFCSKTTLINEGN